MTSTHLAHGTIVQLSKSNATSKTAQGQWCVCILDEDAAQPKDEDKAKGAGDRAEAGAA